MVVISDNIRVSSFFFQAVKYLERTFAQLLSQAEAASTRMHFHFLTAFQDDNAFVYMTILVIAESAENGINENLWEDSKSLWLREMKTWKPDVNVPKDTRFETSTYWNSVTQC